MSHQMRVAFVVLVSLVSGLVAVLALSVVELATGFPLFGFSLLFVLPIWVVVCGVLVGVGFFAGSRLLHVRPTAGMLVVPLLAAALSFVASRWFTFTRYDFAAGRTFADVMTFGDYLRATTTERGVSLGSTASVDHLGWFGYPVAVIEILAVGAGGWWGAAALRARPWCPESRRFMGRIDHRTQRFESQTPFHRAMAEVHRLADEGALAATVRVLPHRQSRSSETENGRFALTVDCYQCPSCGQERVVVTTHERRIYSWDQTTQETLRTRSAAGPAPIVPSG